LFFLDATGFRGFFFALPALHLRGAFWQFGQ